MAKDLYFRVVLTLLLLIGAATTAAANSFYCSGDLIAPGQTGNLYFVLDNSDQALGFQADITLPEDYEFVTVNGKVDATLSGRADGSYRLVSNLLSSRSVRLGTFSTSHTPISGHSGVILTIKVRVLPTFKGGTLTISNAVMVGMDDNDVPLADTSKDLSFIHPAGITLSDTSLALKVGESVALVATVKPDDATDKTVTWTSSNSAVATVDATGKVTALPLAKPPSPLPAEASLQLAPLRSFRLPLSLSR